MESLGWRQGLASLVPRPCVFVTKINSHRISLAPDMQSCVHVASFPGPTRSSLAVQNSLREFRTASDERVGPGNKASVHVGGHYL